MNDAPAVRGVVVLCSDEGLAGQGVFVTAAAAGGVSRVRICAK